MIFRSGREPSNPEEYLQEVRARCADYRYILDQDRTKETNREIMQRNANNKAINRAEICAESGLPRKWLDDFIKGRENTRNFDKYRLLDVWLDKHIGRLANKLDLPGQTPVIL